MAASALDLGGDLFKRGRSYSERKPIYFVYSRVWLTPFFLGDGILALFFEDLIFSNNKNACILLILTLKHLFIWDVHKKLVAYL